MAHLGHGVMGPALRAERRSTGGNPPRRPAPAPASGTPGPPGRRWSRCPGGASCRLPWESSAPAPAAGGNCGLSFDRSRSRNTPGPTPSTWKAVRIAGIHHAAPGIPSSFATGLLAPFALRPALPASVTGRHSRDYYGTSAPAVSVSRRRACPLPGRCDSPAAESFHLRTVTKRLVAHGFRVPHTRDAARKGALLSRDRRCSHRPGAIPGRPPAASQRPGPLPRRNRRLPGARPHETSVKGSRHSPARCEFTRNMCDLRYSQR
jgi:hypothetical protein